MNASIDAISCGQRESMCHAYRHPPRRKGWVVHHNHQQRHRRAAQVLAWERDVIRGVWVQVCSPLNLTLHMLGDTEPPGGRRRGKPLGNWWLDEPPVRHRPSRPRSWCRELLGGCWLVQSADGSTASRFARRLGSTGERELGELCERAYVHQADGLVVDILFLEVTFNLKGCCKYCNCPHAVMKWGKKALKFAKRHLSLQPPPPAIGCKITWMFRSWIPCHWMCSKSF